MTRSRNLDNKGAILPVILLCGVFASCAAQQAFLPAERATGISPQGYPAADYQLDVNSHALGDARVWSNGTSTRYDTQNRRATVTHVGFSIKNRSESTLRLNEGGLRIDIATADRVIEDLPVVQIEGSTSVPPEKDRIVNTYFLLPEGISATKVRAFRVHWQLIDGDKVYAQRTPFMESPEPHPYPARFFYSPFYDPFYYGPFGYPRMMVLHQYPYLFYHRYY